MYNCLCFHRVPHVRMGKLIAHFLHTNFFDDLFLLLLFLNEYSLSVAAYLPGALITLHYAYNTFSYLPKRAASCRAAYWRRAACCWPAYCCSGSARRWPCTEAGCLPTSRRRPSCTPCRPRHHRPRRLATRSYRPPQLAVRHLLSLRYHWRDWGMARKGPVARWSPATHNTKWLKMKYAVITFTPVTARI